MNKFFVVLVMVAIVAGCSQEKAPFKEHVKAPVKKEIRIEVPRISGMTKDQELWCLSFSAVLTGRNLSVSPGKNGSHGRLSIYPYVPEYVESTKRMISEWWGIDDAASLVDSLNWIEEGGHREGFESAVRAMALKSEKEYLRLLSESEKGVRRERIRYLREKKVLVDAGKSISSWDYARYISLCRWGAHSGYLTEREAWARIVPKAMYLYQLHDSWKDVGTCYIDGRHYWNDQLLVAKDSWHIKSFNSLTNKLNTESPWNQVDWDLGKTIDLDRLAKFYQVKLKEDVVESVQFEKGMFGSVLALQPQAPSVDGTLVSLLCDDKKKRSYNAFVSHGIQVGTKVEVFKLSSGIVFVCPVGADKQRLENEYREIQRLKKQVNNLKLTIEYYESFEFVDAQDLKMKQELVKSRLQLKKEIKRIFGSID